MLFSGAVITMRPRIKIRLGKAYWKHHVVNPNVFEDLISHSRPVSNDNGTLVYEVPINRVHCTKGFLGIVRLPGHR